MPSSVTALTWLWIILPGLHHLMVGPDEGPAGRTRAKRGALSEWRNPSDRAMEVSAPTRKTYSWIRCRRATTQAAGLRHRRLHDRRPAASARSGYHRQPHRRHVAVNDEAVGRRYVSASGAAQGRCEGQRKAVVLPESQDAMLLARYGIDRPAAERQNVITVSGLFWNTWVNMNQGHSIKVGFRMASTAADALELRTGPVWVRWATTTSPRLPHAHSRAGSKWPSSLSTAGPEKTFDLPRGHAPPARLDCQGNKEVPVFRDGRQRRPQQDGRPFDVRVPRRGHAVRRSGPDRRNGDMLEGLMLRPSLQGPRWRLHHPHRLDRQDGVLGLRVG